MKSVNGEVSGEKRAGPVRTLRIGDRITVCGDVEVVAIDGAGVHGVRVTPHLFTTTAELDRLVDALTRMSRA